jgi:hypothetical protein
LILTLSLLSLPPLLEGSILRKYIEEVYRGKEVHKGKEVYRGKEADREGK